MIVFFEKFMFILTYIKLCYYLIMIRLATFFNQSLSAQIAHITRLGSFTLFNKKKVFFFMDPPYVLLKHMEKEYSKKRITCSVHTECTSNHNKWAKIFWVVNLFGFLKN